MPADMSLASRADRFRPGARGPNQKGKNVESLVNYEKNGAWAAAVDLDGRIVDLQEAGWNGGEALSTRQVLETGPGAIERAIAFAQEALAAGRVKAIAADGVRIGPVIADPGKILCVGANYRAHLEEADYPAPPFPEVFGKYANALIGPTDAIPLTPASEQVDYEGELAIVIGKTGKNIPREDVLDYIAGYSVVNDISARDIQLRVSQWIVGKSMDGYLPIGPGIVPVSAIPDPYKLKIQTRLNGKVMQDSTTGLLIFDIHHIVSFLSTYLTLNPGDIICTGTPGGVGFYCDPPVFLRDGDLIEVEVENVGVLRNTAKNAA